MPRRIGLIGFLLSTLAIAWVPRAHAAEGTTPALLRSGPMVGFSEVSAVEIWLQTRHATTAQVRFWPAGRPDAARLSPSVPTAPATDHIARFRLANLDAGTRYEYEVYLDGNRVPLPYTSQFQTQHWDWKAAPPPFRFAIGSCLDVGEDEEPSEESQPGGLEILGAILAQKPDAMLWLGDNFYYRDRDLGTEQAMRRRWAEMRALPELQPLLASVHHYAIWDDNDFGSGNSDRTFREREASLRLFREYWANPSYGTPETPGIFGRFVWGDVEFFLLDDRYYRAPNLFPKDADKRMFGREQLRWLEESLAASDARFKIVAGGNQFWNPLVYFEGLGKFPAEFNELRDFLVHTKIPGVVFLSGDRHTSELLKIDWPGLYPIYEFTSSPLTSEMARSASREDQNPARVPGTWVKDRQSFGLLEVSGPAEDRRLTLRAIDAHGQELWRREIRAEELRVQEKEKPKR